MSKPRGSGRPVPGSNRGDAASSLQGNNSNIKATPAALAEMGAWSGGSSETGLMDPRNDHDASKAHLHSKINLGTNEVRLTKYPQQLHTEDSANTYQSEDVLEAPSQTKRQQVQQQFGLHDTTGHLPRSNNTDYAADGSSDQHHSSMQSWYAERAEEQGWNAEGRK